MTYGYARVSSTDQNEDRQLIALRKAGVDEKHIFVDKASGKDFNRPAYQTMKSTVKKGDFLIVQSLDRFGRSYDDIIDEWRFLVKTVGCDIQVLDMPVLDTRQGNGLIGKFIGDIVLQILSFVAETERRKIKERQAQGIAAAKARGVKFGRREVPVPEDMERLVNLFANRELSLTEAAAEANMNRSTFYRNAIRMGVIVPKERHYMKRPRRNADTPDERQEPIDDGSPKNGRKPTVKWVMSLPPSERWQYAKDWTELEKLEAKRIEMKRIYSEKDSFQKGFGFDD